MQVTELKCIEVLIRSLVNKTDLDREALSEFDRTSTFERTKNNLFNLISIDDLLSNFNHIQPFSLELFLHTGIVPGMFEEKTQIPQIDSKYFKDYLSFYKDLLEALQEENYIFDEHNNVFVSSGKLETVIPQVWLYRLAQATKRSKFERMYFYNKNKENNIKDKNELLDYLRHTKTFVVELSSSDPKADCQVEFLSAEAKTNQQVDGNREVKVANVMEIFKSNVSPEYQTTIRKYKLSDAFFLISKAEKMGREFYTEPLEVQQKYINKWMLEFIHSNEQAKTETQKFILLATTKKNTGYDPKDFDKKQVIVGLFNLYITIIKNIGRNYELVSLQDFKIEEYMSLETQDNIKALDDIIKRVNSSRISQAHIRQDLAETHDYVRPLDQVEDEDIISEKKVENASLTEMLKLQEAIELACGQKRNQLQDKIRLAQQNSIEDLAFDNDLIIALIIEAVKRGRVYFKPGTNHLIVELYNDELGKTIFKVSISTANLITFMENFNFGLEELDAPFKMS